MGFWEREDKWIAKESAKIEKDKMQYEQREKYYAKYLDYMVNKYRKNQDLTIDELIFKGRKKALADRSLGDSVKSEFGLIGEFVDYCEEKDRLKNRMLDVDLEGIDIEELERSVKSDKNDDDDVDLDL